MPHTTTAKHELLQARPCAWKTEPGGEVEGGREIRWPTWLEIARMTIRQLRRHPGPGQAKRMQTTNNDHRSLFKGWRCRNVLPLRPNSFIKPQAGQCCYLPFPRVPINLSLLPCWVHWYSLSVSLEKQGLISSPLGKRNNRFWMPQNKTFSWVSTRWSPRFLHPQIFSSFNIPYTSAMLPGWSKGRHWSTHHRDSALGHSQSSSLICPVCSTLSWSWGSHQSANALRQHCSTCPVRLSL